MLKFIFNNFFVQCLTMIKAKFNVTWCRFGTLVITENQVFLEHASRPRTPPELLA